MYVLWYKMKSRHRPCTGKIDRERKRERRTESVSKRVKRYGKPVNKKKKIKKKQDNYELEILKRNEIAANDGSR